MPNIPSNNAAPVKPPLAAVNDFVHAAFVRDHEGVMAFLDTYGVAFVDEKDEYGNTALMLAACWGHIDIVTLLLDKGADIDLKSSKGQSAVMWAENNQRSEVLELFRQWPKTPRPAPPQEKDVAQSAAAATAEIRIGKLKQLRPTTPALKKPGNPGLKG